ncbi:hypothetical protein PR202_ga31401 [Eleusine coracana subsp. coracana]|uniref:ALA-interacting subunit n=1 Tax=Eleusine coracana subsp. coracana TaxID=191504 RepID=A0AAV5DRC9_ELECO|nr:hypothetical protein PR202_ga31401 [Eleusine coracana subsp. coracana]
MDDHAAGSSAGGSGDSGASRRHSRKPKYSKFTQQELPACKPILTPKWVITVFVIVGVIFVPIGIASLRASQQVVEIVDRYDDACVPANATDKLSYIQNSSIPKTCTRTLMVTKDMKQPIFVYYQLDNFYQNHRRYVKSRNDVQLRDASKANDTANCDPEATANGQPIVPCGLIAWTLPTFRKLYGRIHVDLKANDTITVQLENNYNTYSFGGKKKLVLSTATWLGGKNDFLGFAYLSVGGLCFFLAFAFTLLYLIKPRKQGDNNYLSWNRTPTGR